MIYPRRASLLPENPYDIKTYLLGEIIKLRYIFRRRLGYSLAFSVADPDLRRTEQIPPGSLDLDKNQGPGFPCHDIEFETAQPPFGCLYLVSLRNEIFDCCFLGGIAEIFLTYDFSPQRKTITPLRQ